VIGAPLNGTGFGFTATFTVAVAPTGTDPAPDVGDVGSPPELLLHLVAAKAAATTRNGSASDECCRREICGRGTGFGPARRVPQEKNSRENRGNSNELAAITAARSAALSRRTPEQTSRNAVTIRAALPDIRR
jgi:hypothetical protein